MAETIPNPETYGLGLPVISILGSTGSIGKQTLEVASLLGLRVVSLSAGKNIKLLEEQSRKFNPTIAAVFDEDAAKDYKARVRDTSIKVCSGMEGLIEAACAQGADTVVTAVSGTSGLLPTIAAIKLGRRIALANKETLVCAGHLIMGLASEYKTEIIPVDSEHSAILQCLGEHPRDKVKRLILTASGGPFRTMGKEAIMHVTPKMAMRHPVWSMGKKITIDSATMMNKGFEVIEAIRMFAIPAEKIKVVVHPESIIHSMVEFADNSTIAQLAQPDMRLPIQYALTYPQRLPSLIPALDITQISALTFEEPDMEAFPCLGLAIETANIHGTSCAVLNGADEAAVELFLDGKLGFYEISDSIRAALDGIKNIEDPTPDEIIEAGQEAKRFVYQLSFQP